MNENIEDDLRKKIIIASEELMAARRLLDERNKVWWHGYRAALIDVQKEIRNEIQK